MLNPLLAAHMGRWAEVYFTSPPERRAQAVSDLVRELANNPTPENDSSQRDRDDRENDKRLWEKLDIETDEVRAPGVFEAAMSGEPMFGKSIVCESCGHENAPQQKFCGMCGAPLASSAEISPWRFAEAEPVAPTWHESDPLSGKDPQSELESAADSVPETGYGHLPQNANWPPREDRPVEFSALSDYESEPASPSYRIYVGAAVAILLGLLVYMTWRSNTVFWSSGTAQSALPAAVPAAKPEPVAAPEPPAPVLPSPKTDITARVAPITSAPSGRKTGRTRPGKTRGSERRTKSSAPRNVPVAPNPATSAGEQNGSEELAAAEKYLNAGSGTARDSRQAATWLWKAVGKQNSTATLLLSDLYLRGDGVTKSCDQARLLLDAAARKGETAAAARLRNLQAFGCR